MTKTLQRYCRQLPATRQLKRMPLAECLKRLGMKPGKNRAFNTSKINEWELKDLFDAAHHLYKKMVAMLHPDRGGSVSWCARLNELWTRTKWLFARKGINV